MAGATDVSLAESAAGLTDRVIAIKLQTTAKHRHSGRRMEDSRDGHRIERSHIVPVAATTIDLLSAQR
jgi:hypothetical protein